MQIRPLDAARDRAAVMDLCRRAADYVALESGSGPNDGTLSDFFEGAPPGRDPAASVRVGLYRGGRLTGIAEMAFGWPEPRDAYVGLMLFDARARGQGLGRILLGHLEETARARGAERMLVAVIEANPRGLAFWMREGFEVEAVFPPGLIEGRMHVHRRLVRPI